MSPPRRLAEVIQLRAAFAQPASSDRNKSDDRPASSRSADGLLTVEETARALGVSTKTIRRWISSGRLVAHRIGPGSVRVSHEELTRLLAASTTEAASELEMTKTRDGSHREPKLLRQRGKARIWTALIDEEEVSLHTSDEQEARRRLAQMSPKQVQSARGRRLWRIYVQQGVLVAKYYDRANRRRSLSLPAHCKTEAEADEFMGRWYARHVGRPAPTDMPAAVTSSKEVAPDITFEQFGTLFTTGRLAELFPDHVRRKKTGEDDAQWLRLYVYPHIGSEKVADLAGVHGLARAEYVMRQLPPLAAASRRHVAQIMHRLFNIAVYPAKLIPANPLPRGFLPPVREQKAKTYLRPSEDLALMQCTAVPLVQRLLFGFLDREGCRVGEALRLTWRDVDLDVGQINLDENKTDDPRTWTLDSGVTEALRRWRATYAPRASDATCVFRDDAGGEPPRSHMPEHLRDALRKAGVARPQIFEAGPNRLRLRAHDLRATFVTVNLALGKTEAWITDRTGHKSSTMIYRYKRQARTHAESNLGPLAPLHEAIPELAVHGSR